jgi:hypothetical protein
MSGALPLLPIYSFMAWTGRILLLLSSKGALLPPSPGCKTIQLTTRPNLLPVLRIAGAISLFPHTLSLHELGQPYLHSTARTPNITLPNCHALCDVRERIAVAVSVWNHQATELTCPMNVRTAISNTRPATIFRYINVMLPDFLVIWPTSQV